MNRIVKIKKKQKKQITNFDMNLLHSNQILNLRDQLHVFDMKKAKAKKIKRTISIQMFEENTEMSMLMLLFKIDLIETFNIHAM